MDDIGGIPINDIKEFARQNALADAELMDIVEELQKRGWVTHHPEPATPTTIFDEKRLRGDRVKFGVISDTHFGSKFQQPSFLVEHLAYMQAQGVDSILVAGDITDGATRMHPGFEYEIWAHGADAQMRAAAQVLVPIAERMEIPWYLIGGNHDFSHWRQAGVDVVASLCEQSEWFNYLAPGGTNHLGSVGNIRVGRLDIQLNHPHMGGAYALSYRLQKWIEQLAPENKPHLVVMGNFHKVLQLDYRNIFGLMVPSFQAQSAWMASKGIASHIGSAIIDVGIDPMGMAPSVRMEWLLEKVPRERDWPGA